MSQFVSAREAKEFPVGKIVAEAHREGISLSDIERSMLYFSETGWTIPNMMEVAAQFDSECSQDDFEQKIGEVIRNALIRARDEDRTEYMEWMAATRVLDKEDHYLSVMLTQANSSVRPPGDLWKLLGTALAIVVFFVIVFWWF